MPPILLLNIDMPVGVGKVNNRDDVLVVQALPRMKTTLCTRVGIEVPIIQAPMGGAVGPALASAVSNAGGLGMLGLACRCRDHARADPGDPDADV